MGLTRRSKRFWTAVSDRFTNSGRERGIPLFLGTGDVDMVSGPRIVFHWHPPVTVVASADTGNDVRGLMRWAAKLGLKRKSA